MLEITIICVFSIIAISVCLLKLHFNSLWGVKFAYIDVDGFLKVKHAGGFERWYRTKTGIIFYHYPSMLECSLGLQNKLQHAYRFINEHDEPFEGQNK